MWKCNPFSGVFANLELYIISCEIPYELIPTKIWFVRDGSSLWQTQAEQDWAGRCWWLLSWQIICPFPIHQHFPDQSEKFCLSSPQRASCGESTKHSSGRMLGKVFQTFCRARQPRYHAVDETEAVHKHGGAFSAWSCSRTSFRCRTSLHEFKLHRRRGLWNGLVRRALSSLGVSFSQQVQMRFAPPNVVRFCSFQSNNFFILALFLFIAQLRIK